MARGLSYPSLTKILERLDTNKRSLLVAHSPFLQNVERAIPLHVDHLSFRDYKITVNDVSFHFIRREVLVTPEAGAKRELTLGYTRFYDHLNYVLYFFKETQIGARRLPEGMSLEMAFKKFSDHLFEKREDIKVRELRILSKKDALRLPVGTKFQVSELDTADNELNTLENLIHASSFPLKSLRTKSWRDVHQEDSKYEATKTLTIIGSHAMLIPCLDVARPSVHIMGHPLSEQRITEIVRHVKENGKELGSTLTWTVKDEEFMHELIDDLKEEFNGKRVVSQEVGETLPMSQILSVSLNETSEMLIYGFMKTGPCVGIQVVPIGSSTPIPDKNLFNYFKFIIFLFFIIFYGHGMLASLIVFMFSLIIPI